jgi:hypothetical protein
VYSGEVKMESAEENAENPRQMWKSGVSAPRARQFRRLREPGTAE